MIFSFWEAIINCAGWNGAPEAEALFLEWTRKWVAGEHRCLYPSIDGSHIPFKHNRWQSVWQWLTVHSPVNNNEYHSRWQSKWHSIRQRLRVQIKLDRALGIRKLLLLVDIRLVPRFFRGVNCMKFAWNHTKLRLYDWSRVKAQEKNWIAQISEWLNSAQWNTLIIGVRFKNSPNLSHRGFPANKVFLIP